MASILKKPNYTARLPHYGHSMSHRVMFTSSVGHIIPVMFDFLSAGDKVRIRERLFTRTQPLKTCAFVRVTEHIYYFFVPISQIDCYHGQSHYGIQDFTNTNDVSRPITTEGENPALLRKSMYKQPTVRPNITYGQLFDMLFGGRGGNATTASSPWIRDYVDENSKITRYIYYDNTNQIVTSSDEYNVPLAWNAVRLLDMLQYGTQFLTNTTARSSTSASGLSDLGFNPNLLAVYQKIWYDYFRISSWTANNPYAYNLNDGIKNGSFDDYVSAYYSVSGGKPLNSSLFTLHYHPLKKDYFTNIESNPLFSVYDVGGYGVNDFGSSFDLSQIGNMIMSAYGVQLQGLGSSSLTVKDDAGVSARYGDDTRSPHGDDVVFSQLKTSPSDTTMVNSVQQLRLAYAYERLLSITQRAGKHYDDQVRAHLGVSIPKGVSNEAYFLGCHSSELMIGEVVGTAAGSYEDSSSVLGEIAGRGLGASRNKQKTIKFTAPDDGYLMAVYAAVPEIDYRDYGIHRLNLYNQVSDWPRPEFDRLGMQPLYIVESNQNCYGAEPSDTSSFVNTIVGWQYRWSELKLAKDIVHGAFNHTLSDWTSAIVFGQFGNIQYNLYCPPTYLDGIFALEFLPPVGNITVGSSSSPTELSYTRILSVQEFAPNTAGITPIDKSKRYGMKDMSPAPDSETYVTQKGWTSSYMYSRDPLLHSIDFDYKKSSWMSTYGLPTLH